MCSLHGEQETTKPRSCPDDSLYAARMCPAFKIASFDFVCFGKVDERLRVASEIKALPCEAHYDVWSDVIHDNWRQAYMGVEDPRAFMWGDDVYIAVNGPPPPELMRKQGFSYSRRMYIQHVFPLSSTPRVHLSLPRQARDKSYEKNWAPIGETGNNGSDYLFARFVEPHQILQCSRSGQCSIAASTSNRAYFEELQKRGGYRVLHLGTNAVRISDDHYLAVFHGFKRINDMLNWPIYEDYAYVFEAAAPWSIVKVSRQPLDIPRIGFHQFSFSTGLTFVDGRLVFSYSVNQDKSYFLLLTLDEVLADMDTLPEPRNLGATDEAGDLAL